MPRNMVEVVCKDIPERLQQCRGYLNVARCALKLGKPDQARDACSRCVAILERDRAQGESESLGELKRLLHSGYLLRGKANIRLQEWRQATRDANFLKRVKDATSEKDAAQLLLEIEQTAEKTSKKNKKLVKEMSKWIDHAMSQSSDPMGGGGEPSQPKAPANPGGEGTKGTIGSDEASQCVCS